MLIRDDQDKRYTITREYVGKPRAMYVVRFCDRWVGYRWKRQAAERLVAADKARRHAILTGAA